MADDAALVTGVRQISDDVVHPIGIGNILGLQIFDQRWCQFDVKWRSCLECGEQPGGLLRIVEHSVVHP